MTRTPLTPSRINRFRRFARTLVRRIGVVSAGMPGGNSPLLEGHILYELGTNGDVELESLSKTLNVPLPLMVPFIAELGLKRLVTWATRDASSALIMPLSTDVLSITRQGRARISELERIVKIRVSSILQNLDADDHRQLVAAMSTIERLLLNYDHAPLSNPPGSRTRPDLVRLVVRPHLVGDLGFVVHRHAALYAEHYGWDERFEALVAKVAAEFLDNFRPETDRAFIADIDGQIIGSAFVVGVGNQTAKLRMVYVEPEWRGSGLGQRLVEDAMEFARASGARRMSLWTNDVLTEARKLYVKLGFNLTASEPYEGFGKSLVGETWERDL